MQLVRNSLGPDAIIISTHQSERGRGIQVMAALDEPDQDNELVKALQQPEQDVERQDKEDIIFDALAYHGVPEQPAHRLLRAARSCDTLGPIEALASAIDGFFRFAPLPQPASGVTMLVGPPGSGKTSVTAKLAARAAIRGQKVLVGTTDTLKAGAIQQLKAYTELLDQELITVTEPKAVNSIVDLAGGKTPVFIDTPGTNSYHEGEIADLKRFLEHPHVEPVLVLAAGGDPEDAGDIASIFGALGCRRMIVTQLDATRRSGAILGAAYAADIAIAEVSATASIAQGLRTLGPVNLARLITLDPSNAYENMHRVESEGSGVTDK